LICIPTPFPFWRAVLFIFSPTRIFNDTITTTTTTEIHFIFFLTFSMFSLCRLCQNEMVDREREREREALLENYYYDISFADSLTRLLFSRRISFVVTPTPHLDRSRNYYYFFYMAPIITFDPI
jgi:hypothetical protein